MKRAGRKDQTQAAIVQALRSIGVVVLILNQEGIPDLLTYHRGVWLPIEVKNGPRGHLTQAQNDLWDVAPFQIVSSVSQALYLFGVGRPSPEST